jgi:RNA polymerase sigma-70 factor (ECF subfamily)
METVSPETLRAAWLRGRQRWPDVELDLEAMARHVRALNVPAGSVDRRAADLYLAAACAAGLESAALAFDRSYTPQVETYVRRFRLTPDLLDEVRQRFRIRLLQGPPRPLIGQYGGLAPLDAYLRVCAMRIALGLLGPAGSRSVSIPDEQLAREVNQGPDADLLVIKNRYLPAFQAALESGVRALSARDKAILRFHFIDGMNIDALGTVYQVHRATAARWLVDIRRRLFESVRQQLALELRTTPSEFKSLLNAVGSDLQLSLTRLLVGSELKVRVGRAPS